MPFLIIFSIAALGIFFVFYSYRKKKIKPEDVKFSPAWRTILLTRVEFYQHLDEMERKRFEADITRFLANVRIIGVDVEIDITDKLLVASSAVIPVFGFPDWDYTFLDEVLLYPGLFDSAYEVDSHSGEYISGMVGSGGAMEGKMILSKPSLHLGFDNNSDKKNVGIHEFIHLLDKEDGSIDGVPTSLNNKRFAQPWMELIRKKTAKILESEKGGDDINVYGATNEQEFLAVTGEYFFERPHLLKKNHPELYELLAKAFNQDAVNKTPVDMVVKRKLERNDLCPCGSGEKYKRCCMDQEYVMR
jgi:Mlc titration factor MtfA (ptsG expression regulator)